MHPAERTVCCRLIRFSWHGASCPGEILRFSTVSLPEVQKKRGADVDFQAVWAHVSNQKLQVSPRGASDWWRESVRNSVSVHQDKIRGSAITRHHCTGRKGDSAIFCTKKEGYLGVCRATKRVDSIGEKLYPTCRLVAHASAALAQAGLRPGSVLGSGPPFMPHSPKIGPQGWRN